MARNKELEEYLEEFRKNRSFQKQERLQEYSQILSLDFQGKIDVLLKEQLRRQEKKEQDKIKYIYLFQLASSFYTESFEALLGISNEKLYLDEYQSQIFWCPRVVYENIEEDMAAAEKSIRRKFVRIEDFELTHIKRKLLSDDWGIVQAIFRILSEQAIDSIRKTSLMLQDEVFFLCGDYMDEIKAVKVCY